MRPDAPIHFPPFTLEPASERLLRGASAVPLTPKAFSVLRVLLENAGRLVTKEEILDVVWARTHVRDAVLKVCVREIRRALGDPARSPRYIETVHRRGYRFIERVIPSPGREPRAAAADDGSPSAAARGLVGRAPELARMVERLARAGRGERQVLFVTGEPGIGKTAVVEAFLEDAAARDPDVWIARGKCLEQYGAGEAYLPILEAIGRLCREAGGRRLVTLLRRFAPTWLVQMPSVVGEIDRHRLQREIIGATSERMLREMAETIEALTADVPLILAIEDLHWSDYSTLDLIASLARRREPARLLLIGTYREAEVILTHHPLKSVKQELQMRRQCHELPLGLLSEAAVEAYVETRLPHVDRRGGLARSIHRRTEGNPLFMVNVVDYLVARGPAEGGAGPADPAAAVLEVQAGVPENLRQLIARQVERLRPEEQATLESASVAGFDFTPLAVAAGLEGSVEASERDCEALAQRGQFLRATGAGRLPDGSVTARYDWIHSLYQNVLYHRVPLARRMRMHQRIAQRGIDVYGRRVGEIAAELAVHLEQARDYGTAIHHLRKAADNAARRYANREAVAHLTRAADLVGRLPEAERGDLPLAILEQCGTVRRSMADMRGAADDFEALVRLAREQQRADAEARGLFFLGSALSWIDRRRFEAVTEQAELLAARLRDPLLRAHTRGYAAYWHLLLRGWRDEDAQASARALEVARRRRDRVLLGQHVGRHAYFRCLRSDYRAGCRAAREGMKLALQAGDAFDYLLCHFFLAWGLLHSGEWGEMLKVLGEGITMAEKNGHHLWSTLLRLEMAWLHEQAFDFQPARGLCEEALERARAARHGHSQIVSLVLLGAAHAGLDDPERARHCFSQVGDLPERERALMDWSWQMPLSLCFSEHWLARGDLARAGEEADRVATLAALPGERSYLALARRMTARIALAAGDRRAAESAIASAIAALEGVDAPLAAWQVYGAAAEVTAARRPREARAWRARSAAIVRRIGASLETGSTLRRSLMAAPAVQAVTSGTAS